LKRERVGKNMNIDQHKLSVSREDRERGGLDVAKPMRRGSLLSSRPRICGELWIELCNRGLNGRRNTEGKRKKNKEEEEREERSPIQKGNENH
jgi:hypothetical protein